MQRTGVANLPLHGGKAPKWLFKRMVKLSQSIIEVISYEYGKDEFIKRLSDPFWFQALSCVLGFDYHSSGCTTVTCGALKEAIKPDEHGFAIAGGKGKTSRKTPEEIEKIGEDFNFTTSKIEEMKYSSRLSAKVDNTAIQDGHDLYHHVFLFTENGKWAVIQQGLCEETKYARRYHWFSENISNFVCDPHNAIIGEKTEDNVLNMASKDSVSCQKTCADLVCDHPRHIVNDWASLTRVNSQTILDEWNNTESIDKKIVCPECKGNDVLLFCKRCRGQKYIFLPKVKDLIACNMCKGTGQVDWIERMRGIITCRWCEGSGKPDSYNPGYSCAYCSHCFGTGKHLTKYYKDP